VKRSNFLLQFGKQLADARRRNGMSQEQLAHAARIHQVTVSLIENGRRAVTLTTLERLAKALHIQPADLIPRIKER
jgi:transcriptional regulator with XRE-family HTH domain